LTFPISSCLSVAELFDIVREILRKASKLLPSIHTHLPSTASLESFELIQVESENSVTKVEKEIDSIIGEVTELRIAGTKISKSKSEIRKTLKEVGVSLVHDNYFFVDTKRYLYFFFKLDEKTDDDDSDGGMKSYPTQNAFRKKEQHIHKFHEETQGKDSVMGKCGLKNIGNTCFMNSGLQCLSNCTELTEYFLRKEFKDDINVDNPMGSKGRLVRAYGELINRMWYGTDDYVSPIDFKSELSAFQSMVTF
jgi:hypothetical protein